MITFAVAAVLLNFPGLPAISRLVRTTTTVSGKVRSFADPAYVPIHDVWCSQPVVSPSDGKMHLYGTFELSANFDVATGWGTNTPTVYTAPTPDSGLGPIQTWTAMASTTFTPVSGQPDMIAFDATFSVAQKVFQGIVAISLSGTPADFKEVQNDGSTVTFAGRPEVSFAITAYPTVILPPGHMNNVIPIELIDIQDAKKVYAVDPDKLHFFAHNSFLPLPDIYGFTSSSSGNDPIKMENWGGFTWTQISHNSLKPGKDNKHGFLTPNDLGSADYVLIYASDPTDHNAAMGKVKTYECDGVLRSVK